MTPAIFATLLFADVAPMEAGRMTLHPPSGNCFAIVRIENRMGGYFRTETLQTEHGPVSIRYHTVGDHAPGDDDIVEVMSLPPGVAALPMHMELPDDDTGEICLMEYVAG